MALISQTTIQELQNRLDAVAVVSDYVQLEKRGGRFWACCPFHQEKTASFTVNPEVKSYYCFGCHKGGSVISFVMEMDKLSYPEAVEILAKKFAVELVYEQGGSGFRAGEDEAKKKVKEELFELYQRISGTFHHFLLKKREAEAAKQYILARGITIEIVERFRLGYVPEERQWLYRFLGSRGYSAEFLASSGLFSSRHPDYSLFTGRLIFPIADRQGRTVAFGGRYLPGGAPARDGWEPPKYINSPELGIYKKGETLYAIDLALPEIRQTKTAYIAEGYMDVIALHQAGITNAVAPLGTAFTEEQARLLKRWAEKIILFFDTDGAGQNAALKAIYTCRRNGIPCALIVPDTEETDEQQKDPADILLKQGSGALQKKSKCFINDFDYLLAKARILGGISGRNGAASRGGAIEGKARAVSFLFDYIDLLDSEVARDSCIEAAADAFGLLPSVVQEDYRRHVSGKNPAERRTDFKTSKEELSGQSGGKTISPIRMNDELSTLAAVAVNFVYPRKERIFPKFRAALEIENIDDPNAKEIYIALEECLRYGETGMDELLARITSPELKKFLMERSSTGEFSVNPEQLISDGIRQCKVKKLKNQQREIIIKLRETKSMGSAEERNSESRELLAEKMRIDSELHTLEQGRKA